MHRRPIVILFIVGFALLINGYWHHDRAAQQQSIVITNKTMPALSLRNAQGEMQPLDTKALGGKVTVINFFASWCAPCKTEMPELVKLKKETDAQFIGIAWNATPESMRAWLKQFGDPFDTVWYDDHGESVRVLGLRGIPETFIVDKKGNVRHRVTGAVEPSVVRDKLLPLILQLQNE
jgi:cytochrome c biogenesis protein CcmG/thiol:disulfide interchange protein DsbE